MNVQSSIQRTFLTLRLLVVVGKQSKKESKSGFDECQPQQLQLGLIQTIGSFYCTFGKDTDGVDRCDGSVVNDERFVVPTVELLLVWLEVDGGLG